MTVGTLTVKGRTYIDCVDLMNALEAWKPRLGDEGAAVLDAIYKTIDKAMKS